MIAKIVQADGTVLVDLGATWNINLEEMTVYPLGDGRVTRTLRIFIEGTETVQQAAHGALTDALDAAAEYHNDKASYDPIYLLWGTNNESGKYGLIWDYALVGETGLWNESLEWPVSRWKLAITHDVDFEETADSSVTDHNISVEGGTVDLGATVSGGNRNGRITNVFFDPDGSTFVKKLWAGIKPARADGYANFNPVIDINSGAPLEASTTEQTGYTEVSFSGGAGETMAARTEVTLNDHAGAVNIKEYYGRYKVLLRYRFGSTAATTVGVRLSPGWNVPTIGQISGDFLNIVYLTSENPAAWRYVSLGEVQFPPQRGLMQATLLNFFSLVLWAERIEGTASLQAAKYILVPAEHNVFTERQTTYDPTVYQYVRTTPEGDVQGYVGGAPVLETLLPTAQDWAYPYDGGLLVMAAEAAGGVETAGLFATITFTIRKRWQGYRL